MFIVITLRYTSVIHCSRAVVSSITQLIYVFWLCRVVNDACSQCL